MVTLNVAEHGFEGCLFEATGQKVKKCLILNLMFAPGGMMMKKTANWLVENGISALNLASWGTKQTVPDENLVPVDYVLAAATYLKKRGYEKIGVVGLSMSAVMSMYAAALCKDITLTIAISGYDMVFEGVLGRGNQYPSGHSTLTLNGEELPFQPFYLDKEGYQSKMKEAKKLHGENYGRDLWEDAINKCKNEEALVPVEEIQGHLVLLNAANDTCWDSYGAAVRIEKRIKDYGSKTKVTAKCYPHATHMLYPETVPFINFMTRMAFKEMKKYPEACKAARKSVSHEILKAARAWE